MSDDFSAWVGRSETLSDILEPARTNALLAALGDLPVAQGAPLPLLHHWLYFWDVKPPEGLGTDGHPARGGFLPPVPLPRRMWAGGRLKFLKPLLVGEQVTRVSTILEVKAKSGKSGNLVFVTVQHELSGGQGLAIVEEQDIVYREAAAPGSIPAPTPGDAPGAPWCRDVMPDSVLLFRYSALTMNGHRIHYDRPYAMGEEAYPGLVVHGPLQATLLADLAVKSLAALVTGFDFRGQSPAFDGALLHVRGEKTDGGASLWTQQGGTKNMVATITCG
ncbi:MAG TPA: MaoC family dehydratase N-terminal domain-containing protein [Sphingobium sp.]|uniref:FAS1-like dehydratase domain-containing protein n=1 Tax=Sphingobium sp. TaxID=1912891 RepID=UPI002ED21E70